MIIFKSRHIEKCVRKLLDIKANRALTQEDLAQINGIFIREAPLPDSGIVFPIRWNMDSSAHQMQIPDLCLSHAEMAAEDWQDDIRRFTHIKSFYCNCEDISLDGFICSFPNLTNLMLSRTIIHDWSFLSELKNLHMVELDNCGNGNEALKHLSGLYAAQQKRIKLSRDKGEFDIFTCRHLDYIAVTDMDVSDLSPFKKITDVTELDLSWNSINDISALSGTQAYCLTLRHNKIEDISQLNLFDTYLLNLRWNHIRSLKPILDIMDNRNKAWGYFNKPLARLFINHNDEIPDAEKQELAKHYFVYTDFDLPFEGGISTEEDDPQNGFTEGYWRIEKITYKNGRPRRDSFYPKTIGRAATNIVIGAIALWNHVTDNENKVRRGWFHTSHVERVKSDDATLRITTQNSIYTLRRLPDEEAAELEKMLELDEKKDKPN